MVSVLTKKYAFAQSHLHVISYFGLVFQWFYWFGLQIKFGLNFPIQTNSVFK